jgi:outer membrane protein assembly factor BamB
MKHALILLLLLLSVGELKAGLYPMQAGSLRRENRGMENLNVKPPLDLVWRTPNCVLGPPKNSPLVIDQRVIQAAEHGLMCVDRETGSLIWLKSLEGIVKAPIYDASRDLLYVQQNNAALNAIDLESGNIVWQFFEKDVNVKYRIAASPIYDGQYLYFCAASKEVICLNPENQQVVWRKDLGGLHAFNTMSFDNQELYLPDQAGNIYKLDALTGNVIWSIKTVIGSGDALLLSDDKIYRQDVSGLVECRLRSNGSLVWSYRCDSWGLSTPAISCGKLIVANDDRNVRALDLETGAELWKRPFMGNFAWSAPFVSCDVVYVSGCTGAYYGLDVNTGTTLWTFQHGIDNSFVDWSQEGGWLFTHDRMGNLYAFKPSEGNIPDVCVCLFPSPTPRPSCVPRTRTVTYTPSPTFTFTSTDTVTPTSTDSPTDTATITCTYSSTSTPTYTATPSSTASPTDTATATSTNTPTSTSTHTGTPTATSSASITGTVTGTFTLTATQSASATASDSPTVSKSATLTHSASATQTLSHTLTSSITQTMTPTLTGTHTQTASPVLSASITQTKNMSVSDTHTPTKTSTNTPAQSMSPSLSATSAHSVSESPSRSASPSASITQTLDLTLTLSPSFSASKTSSVSPSESLSGTSSQTQSTTCTPTPSASSSPTTTATLSRTPTHSSTWTESFTATKTPVLGAPTTSATRTSSQTPLMLATAVPTVIPCFDTPLGAGLIAVQAGTIHNAASVVDGYDSSKGVWGPGNQGGLANVVVKGSLLLNSGMIITGQALAHQNVSATPVPIPLNATPLGIVLVGSGQAFHVPAGDYVCDSMTLNGNSQWIADGPVRLWVKGPLTNGGLLAPLSKRPKDLQIMLPYGQQVALNGGSETLALIHAPLSTALISASLSGALVCGNATLNSQGAVHVDASALCSAAVPMAVSQNCPAKIEKLTLAPNPWMQASKHWVAIMLNCPVQKARVRVYSVSMIRLNEWEVNNAQILGSGWQYLEIPSSVSLSAGQYYIEVMVSGLSGQDYKTATLVVLP